MKKLSQGQLKELESLGELQFSLEECAIILKIPHLPALYYTNPEIAEAYERGRLKASAAVRKAILQQAKQGSTPAQKQMLELIQKVEIKSVKQPTIQKNTHTDPLLNFDPFPDDS